MKLDGVGQLMALFIYINLYVLVHVFVFIPADLKHHQLSPHQSFSWYRVISRILK